MYLLFNIVMKCPYCGLGDDKVIDSRPGRDGAEIRRRRECLGCGRRFTTYEYIEKISLMVKKRDGRREPFEREKLLQGIRIASRKRPISTEKIESIVNEIETALFDLGIKEVESREIGEKVMEKLKQVDDVTYIRFASVYRSFKDTKEFLEEVSGLLEKKEDSKPQVSSNPLEL